VSSPFLAEIRIWACNFAPNGWAFCDGQVMPLSQNTALFSLLGTTYGGDGKTTFGLPNLQGAAPMHWGTAQSGTSYEVGETGGETSVTLQQQQVPSHGHSLQASARPANLNIPSPLTSLGRSTPVEIYKQPAGAAAAQPLAPGVLNYSGSGLPHNNMMPYLTLNLCIALQGVYPPRS
jgi:microcystin-dependent protein